MSGGVANASRATTLRGRDCAAHAARGVGSALAIEGVTHELWLLPARLRRGGRVHRSGGELLSTGLTDGGERIADLRLGDLLLGRGVLPSSLARQIGEREQADE